MIGQAVTLTGAEVWLVVVVAPLVAWAMGVATGWHFAGRRVDQDGGPEGPADESREPWDWPDRPPSLKAIEAADQAEDLARDNCLGCREGMGRHAIDCPRAAA